VVTAIISDDAEMARRLNQEAAKSIKYGGLSEEEAWKLCTLNPARMLHIDHKAGSIRAGKDADVVLWNTNPLSMYARAEMTLVDGICFYSLDENKKKEQWIHSERKRILQSMLEAKQSGSPTRDLQRVFDHLYHCESIDDGHTTDQQLPY
jgi:cytosine/adenosine deaminase-related metal-dependent hydrolase